VCLISSDTSGPGRLWDPEEVLPAYEQLRSLIDKWQPVGKNIDIIDGEHGFYTACASTAAVGDGWPWAGATSDNHLSAQLCGGSMKQDVRARGVSSQDMQAVFLARAMLVNMIANISFTMWYDWRDPVDDVHSSGAAVFGLIHCLANDTSANVAASGECEQTTPSVDAMGLTPNWTAHPKLSYVAMRTLDQQLNRHATGTKVQHMHWWAYLLFD
jgi:hypothetical protein